MTATTCMAISALASDAHTLISLCPWLHCPTRWLKLCPKAGLWSFSPFLPLLPAIKVIQTQDYTIYQPIKWPFLYWHQTPIPSSYHVLIHCPTRGLKLCPQRRFMILFPIHATPTYHKSDTNPRLHYVSTNHVAIFMLSSDTHTLISLCSSLCYPAIWLKLCPLKQVYDPVPHLCHPYLP